MRWGPIFQRPRCEARWLPAFAGTTHLDWAPANSPLHERAVVEPAVEPVLIAGDVLLHRDVDEGLVERDARDVGEGKLDEALHVLVVACLVAFGRRGHRTVDQRVELLRLVAH